MDLPSLAAITAYQIDRPPLHMMVAQYLGIKPGADSPAAKHTPAEQEAAAAMAMQSMPATPMTATHMGSIMAIKAAFPSLAEN